MDVKKEARRPRSRRTRPGGVGPSPPSWAPRSSTDVLLPPIYTHIPRKHPGAPEIGSSATASLYSHQKPIGTLFRHPAGGGSLTGGHLHHPDLWGNHSPHHPLLTWDNALIMMIITLLFTYNSRIITRYLEQNMTLCECLRRCTGKCNDSGVTCMKNYERWLCHKYDVNYMIMQSNMTMMEHVMINETVESCMAIYLGMAMEMP